MCRPIIEKNIIIGREIIISREGDTYFAGRRSLFRGKEIIISREGDNYFAGGTYYFAGGR